MSAKATFWAWQQELSSSPKLLLLALANCHNDGTGQCNPAFDYLKKNTGLSKNTIIKSLDILEEKGLIKRIKRNGAGNNYELQTSTKIDTGLDDDTSTKSDTSTKINTSTKIDTATSTKIDTAPVPKLIPEPKKNLKKNLKVKTYSDFDFSKFPEKPSEQVWLDYLAMRKRKKAPLSATVITRFSKTLTELYELGHRVDDVIGEAIERNWTGLKTEWIHKPNQTVSKFKTRDERNAEIIEKRNAELFGDQPKEKIIQGEVITHV